VPFPTSLGLNFVIACMYYFIGSLANHNCTVYTVHYSYIPFLFVKQSAKEEVQTTVDQLREAESEAKALRSMTQRMILTQEEMVCNSSSI